MEARIRSHNMESSIDVLNRGGALLACASRKLVNLNALLMHLQAQHNGFYVEDTKNSIIAEASLEKALILDTLSNVLDSEVREVEDFVNNIQSEMIDARHKLYLCRNSTELLTMLDEKLNLFDELLKKTRNQVAELKMQSFKLQRDFSALRSKKYQFNGFTAQGKMSILITNLKRQTAQQQRRIIKMMERKAPTRQVYLEKKLDELRHNEEQLKSKLHCSEQVSLQMEEAMEVIWGRFLEAENCAAVLMGISKELVDKLQLVEFSLNGSLKREAELKSELQSCLSQLNVNDAVVKSLEKSIVEHIKKSFQVPVLTEKVHSLEEQLKMSEMQLKHADDFNEEMQEQLGRMETLIEDLKLKVAKAENRNERVEEQRVILSERNVELGKEVSLLRLRVKSLECSLEETKNSKATSAKQISSRTELIMDTVVQLAKERELIENQVLSLMNKNAILIEKLRNAKRKVVVSKNEALTDASESRVSELEVQKNKLCRLAKLGSGLMAVIAALVAVVFIFMILKNEETYPV